MYTYFTPLPDFSAEVVHILNRIYKINFLKFQRRNNSILSRFEAKELSFNLTLIINTFFIKINQKNITQTILDSHGICK